MPSVKVSVSRYTNYTIEHDGHKYQVQCSPEEDSVVIEPRPGGGVVIGYLCRDDACANPLEDSDGSGRIYSAHRNASYEDHAKMQEALGLDSNWRRDDDLEPNPHAVQLSCYSHGGEVWAPMYSSTARNFPDQRWDVGRGAGVWVPDDACEEHIRATAIRKLLPCVNVSYESKYNPDGTAISRPCKPGERSYFKNPDGSDSGTTIDERYFNVITITYADGTKKGGYKNFVTAYLAAAKRLGVKPDEEERRNAEAAVAFECASQACETLNAWSSGDCYGVLIEEFDADGDLIGESDECWGYIGLDDAQHERDAGVAAAVVRAAAQLEKPEANKPARDYRDGKVTIAWVVEDVLDQAKVLGLAVTRSQADEFLEEIEDDLQVELIEHGNRLIHNLMTDGRFSAAHGTEGAGDE